MSSQTVARQCRPRLLLGSSPDVIIPTPSLIELSHYYPRDCRRCKIFDGVFAREDIYRSPSLTRRYDEIIHYEVSFSDFREIAERVARIRRLRRALNYTEGTCS